MSSIYFKKVSKAMKDSEILKQFRAKHKLSQSKFAQEVGVSAGLVAAIELGDRSITLKFNQKVIDRFNESLLNTTVAKTHENIIAIPLYRISASAGAGTSLADEPEIDNMFFDKRFLKQILKSENYSSLHLIYAKGDSMDSGWNQPDDIRDGDLLMIDTSQTTGNNSIFVISFNNELRVKRLFKRGETLYISSNNSNYKEESYTPDESEVEVKVIGKVVWNGSKENV